MSSTTRLATALLILALVSTCAALKCWQCGQYSDGVGSITPCANRTAARLEDCPSGAKYCIKYVSELTVVRDCVPTCSEKDVRRDSWVPCYFPFRTESFMNYGAATHNKWWGARTFCCDTDECNSSSTHAPLLAAICAGVAALYAAR